MSMFEHCAGLRRTGRMHRAVRRGNWPCGPVVVDGVEGDRCCNWSDLAFSKAS